MNEHKILGPGLDLRRYSESSHFDLEAFQADLGYFVREHGAAVVSSLIDVPRHWLTRLQYAPDNFSYTLVGGRLVANEDLRLGRLVDARTRVDATESRRGAAAHYVLTRINQILFDKKSFPAGEAIVWVSPKEGFSQHAYLNLGEIGEDELGRRRMTVGAFMSDFSQPQLLAVAGELTGVTIDARTDPRLTARMVLSAKTTDMVSACQRALGTDCAIEGVPVANLYGPQSKTVWRHINHLIRANWPKIREIVKKADGQIERMHASLAQALFGLIESTVWAVGGREKSNTTHRIDSAALMAAFARAVAGCVGLGAQAILVGSIAPIPAVMGESDVVHCPNCNRQVHCAIGERCPGCRQVRPC